MLLVRAPLWGCFPGASWLDQARFRALEKPINIALDTSIAAEKCLPENGGGHYGIPIAFSMFSADGQRSSLARNDTECLPSIA
jgi:hypothetical protein